jgi:hypothetical protein
MSDQAARDQITQLEARIDELAESIERCRKVDLAAKITMAVGGAWLLGLTLGVVSAGVMSLIAARTAVIGGIVVFGSNVSTSRQMSAAMADAEARRADLIGSLPLHVVSGKPTDAIDDP